MPKISSPSAMCTRFNGCFENIRNFSFAENSWIFEFRHSYIIQLRWQCVDNARFGQRRWRQKMLKGNRHLNTLDVFTGHRGICTSARQFQPPNLQIYGFLPHFFNHSLLLLSSTRKLFSACGVLSCFGGLLLLELFLGRMKSIPQADAQQHREIQGRDLAK